jgi:signal transduction histidine kinase
MGWAKSQQPGVKYIIENPYEHLVLNIDDSNIGHIIEQVAENAARYTDSGMVKARYDYIGDRLLITIADSGCGIDSQQQKRLFERFSSPGNNGTGLGLPICRELAHQMGGDVYLNSAPGKGTTVWILIPCEAIQIEKKQLSN